MVWDFSRIGGNNVVTIKCVALSVVMMSLIVLLVEESNMEVDSNSKASSDLSIKISGLIPDQIISLIR